MRKELRRYSSIGNKEGILLLCKKMLQKKTIDIPSVEATCLFIDGIDLNFKCGLLALEALNLITINGTQSIADKIFYDATINDSLFVKSICNYCIETLIQSNEIDVSLIKYNDTLDSFQMPMRAISLNCAVYRNMLISLGALEIKSMLLIVNKHYENIFSKCVKHKKGISQEQLLIQLEKERKIGEEGETYILNFERSRCNFTADQISKIKQISIIDASAGYDIISYHSADSFKRRYIEVKTYIGRPHFYWSVNEINVAKLRENDYYIYLVDYSQINNKQYKPIIISNPLKYIKESAEWIMSPSTYYVDKESILDENKTYIEDNQDLVKLAENNLNKVYPMNESVLGTAAEPCESYGKKEPKNYTK